MKTPMPGPRPLLHSVLIFSAAAMAWTGITLDAGVRVPVWMANGAGAPGAIAASLGCFTVLTNTLAALSLTVALLLPRSRPGRWLVQPKAVTAIGLAMFIIGALYGLPLRQLWAPEGPQKVADLFLHILAPWSYLLTWMVTVPRHDPRLLALGAWLSYPAGYLLLTLLRGRITSTVPYFFIDVAEWGLPRVLINCAWITAAFLVAGTALMALDRLKPRTQPTPMA